MSDHKPNTKMKTLLIRIQDTKDVIDMWDIAIQDYFNFGKDLLSEYVQAYPELKEKFMEKRRISPIRIRASADRPCTIQFTDGDFFKQILEKQKTDRLAQKLMEQSSPDQKFAEIMRDRWYDTVV